MTNLRNAIAQNRLLKTARPKRRRKDEEGQFQAAAIDLLEAILPADAVCTSIDHANARSAVAGALRKRRGVLPGIPDIYIAWGTVTVWFETKARLGHLGIDQATFRDAVLAIGHYWAAPRTEEEIVALLERSGIPIKKVRFMASGARLITPR